MKNKIKSIRFGLGEIVYIRSFKSHTTGKILSCEIFPRKNIISYRCHRVKIQKGVIKLLYWYDDFNEGDVPTEQQIGPPIIDTLDDGNWSHMMRLKPISPEMLQYRIIALMDTIK